MHKNRTKNKRGCQSGRKVVTHNSKSDLLLVVFFISKKIQTISEKIRQNQMISQTISKKDDMNKIKLRAIKFKFVKLLLNSRSLEKNIVSRYSLDPFSQTISDFLLYCNIIHYAHRGSQYVCVPHYVRTYVLHTRKISL